ncbi:hypothetical protein [Myroides fluvii]|uniref:hypothetical protein n=1 Tax=Myroides fluvii TaxID=2572594 RepID=UPI00131B14A9|nr:hypothetical protein [Myroides fluvii]
MFDIKYRQYAIWVMIALLVFSVLIVVDLVFLPHEKTEETIESYGFLTQGNTKEVVGYRYLTDKGTKFSINKDYIRGDQVTIQRTLLFKEIVDIKTPSRDYTKLLASGFNGFTLVLLVILAVSCGISVFNLWGVDPIPVNRYHNFVMFTAFVFFCTASMWFLFN